VWQVELIAIPCREDVGAVPELAQKPGDVTVLSVVGDSELAARDV